MTFCRKITVESENCFTGEGGGLQNILFGFYYILIGAELFELVEKFN